MILSCLISEDPRVDCNPGGCDWPAGDTKLFMTRMQKSYLGLSGLYPKTRTVETLPGPTYGQKV